VQGLFALPQIFTEIIFLKTHRQERKKIMSDIIFRTKNGDKEVFIPACYETETIFS
jgi:hypothetical protein